MSMFTRDIGIDLGTANTLVCVRGKGIIMREPSVVAVDVRNLAVRAVGTEAKEMIGRTPGSIVAVRPLKDGVIADYDVTATMLKRFIREALKGGFVSRARIVICIPSGVTEVEARAVHDAAYHAGARNIDLIEEPMAAALGAGLPVWDAAGSMVVDIGGGTSEVAIISLGDIVTSRSVRTAGDDFDEAIINFIRRKHNLLIGERTAEEMKMSIGCVFPPEEEMTMEIKGRCLLTGLPKLITVTSTEMMDAFEEPVERIMEAVHQVLERTPPELVADISSNGIVMTGGGSLIRGFDKLVTARTGIHTVVAENAIQCVAEGTGKSLESVGEMKDGTMNLSRRKQIN